MNEAQRQEWNAAVASGDQGEIARLQDFHLTDIARRHQDELLWEHEMGTR